MSHFDLKDLTSSGGYSTSQLDSVF